MNFDPQPFAIVPNATLQRLDAGELALGFGVGLVKSVGAAQLAHTAGYHWLAIDTEHHSLTVAEAAQLSLACLPVGITPIVRVRAQALHEGARALDNGAQGVLVPEVNSRQDAQRMVDALHFAPLGRRSWGAQTANFRYAAPHLADALEQANEQTLLAAMIETTAGVANSEAIASIQGINVLFVGALDLSISLGAPGRLDDGGVHRALESVALACRNTGKTLGLGGIQQDGQLSELFRMGARFIALGSDQNWLLSASSARARHVSALLERG